MMTRTERGTTAACLGLVLVAALAVFAGCLGYGFVWDDTAFIVRNPFLHDPGNIPRFFLSGDATGTGEVNPYYRPVTTATFALDLALWGDANPAGFHATNLLLHLAACAAMFLVLRRLVRSAFAATLAALLFAVHPAHSEPVAYVSARADILCGLFLLCALLFHLRDEAERSSRDRAASIAFFILAILSKIVAVVFPLLLAVRLALFAGRSRRWRVLVPYAVVVAAFLVVRGSVLAIETWGNKVPLPVRFANAGLILLGYARCAVFPPALKVFHHLSLKGALDPSALIAWGTLAAGGCLAVARGRRDPELAFGLAWFFATLLPVCGIVTMLFPAYMADRYLYIPLAGAAVSLAAFLDRRTASGAGLRFPGAATAALALAVCVCAVFTASRLPVWRDHLSMWKAAAAEAPNHPYALCGLGWALWNKGVPDEAEKVLHKAIALSDKSADPHVILALIDFGRGDRAGEERHVCRALELEPGNAKALSHLGVIKAEKGYLEDALRLFEASLRIDPYNEHARANREIVLRRAASPGISRLAGGTHPEKEGRN